MNLQQGREERGNGKRTVRFVPFELVVVLSLYECSQEEMVFRCSTVGIAAHGEASDHE
jgi:hypothetical protein